MCQNPPDLPEKWKEKVNGRKIYFYNTSLGGLLHNTEKFLKKMKYVFETFDGRENACLLWRPHPLINATLTSMRPEAQIIYEQLKKYFIENNLGIYDDTSDIDKSIALSDVYIGDTKTSVTSLFGVAGKPTFFLNNNVNVLPTKNEQVNVFIRIFHPESKDWMITQGNRLYHAENHDYYYHHYCDLSEYATGNYYKYALEINGKVYVFPLYAQDILLIGDHKVEKRIQLKYFQNKQCLNLFSEVIHIGDYIFILPNHYPDIVCYNIKNDNINYLSGFKDFFILPDPYYIWRNSCAVWNENLLIASPNKRAVLIINTKTFEMQNIAIPSKQQSKGGFISIAQDGDAFWLLPYEGQAISRLDMQDGSVTEYNQLPQGFQCRSMPQGFVCNERPFSAAVCDENELFLFPYFGNMFVRLNKKTGQMQEWKTPFNINFKPKNPYFNYPFSTILTYLPDKKEIFFMDLSDRNIYNFDLESKIFNKIDIKFDIEELKLHANGFREISEWVPYGCSEGVLQTLPDLIEGNLPGKSFDKDTQLKAYEKINASMDGKSGERIYQFVKQKLEEKEKK